MLRYFLRRLLGAIPTLFLIVVISFFMIRLAPGGPFSTERQVPKEVEQALLRAYHLDEPLWLQFLHYLEHLLQGDFGRTLAHFCLSRPRAYQRLHALEFNRTLLGRFLGGAFWNGW